MQTNLTETITSELSDIDPTEDVFEQLLEIFSKVKNLHKISDMDEEDYGRFLKKLFNKKDFSHLFSQIASQRSNQLKPNAFFEIKQSDYEKDLINHIRTFKLKKFKPTHSHQMECEGVFDNIETLPRNYQPDSELSLEFTELFNTHYKGKHH